ncbi:MAG: imidazole glycerol phosphate synthase subunit HisH [Gammaproteobacteria bacterium]|nr:imidazole glycerol phosphate synthase subunit HisH [Gammaproteobacteria bacterium]
MSLIAVVDYGMGNLRSVSKALEHVASSDQVVKVTSDPADIEAADRVVFPGQGAARDCMLELKQRGLIEPVLKAAREKPFFGICMGMQVLLAHSQENNGVVCMGLYDGEVRFFGKAFAEQGVAQKAELLKIPHMGWNRVQQVQDHPLWQGVEQDSRFYFVHSYYVSPADESIAAGKTDFGINFVSAIARDNVFATQFHPEKSAADGLRLLENFTRWNGSQN